MSSKNSQKMSFIVLSFLLFIMQTQSFSWVQLFGLEDLVQDLVKATPTIHYTGEESVSYAVDDKLANFLKNFNTRTEFCDYKCPEFYQFACFILFQCNIQIRNFILMILLPLFLIALVGLCCGRGIWTFACWGKYIGLFTGFFFVLWFLKKFIKGYEILERRKKEKEYMKEQRELAEIDIEPVLTQKRFNDENS